MIGERQRRLVAAAEQQLARPVGAALLMLAEAYDYASDMQCDLWDFAVEIDALRACGLSVDDLCWLVGRGYAEQRREVTTRRDAARRFRPARIFDFGKNTCFVVTTAGLRLTTVAARARRLQRAA